MSTITELNPRLLALTEAGVSAWLDRIRRSMVEGGELAREDLDATATYEHIAILDVQLAADVLAEVQRSSNGRGVEAAVAEPRVAIRAGAGAATTFGYGPRDPHSTGQLHRGGPRTGRFLQIVGAPERDAEIPGAGYSFGTLFGAQATGDLETLHAHGLAAERVEVEGDPAEAVRGLTARITAILQEN